MALHAAPQLQSLEARHPAVATGVRGGLLGPVHGVRGDRAGRIAPTCSFDAGTHFLSVTSAGFDVLFAKDGTNLSVSGTDCAALNNVDTVNVDMQSNDRQVGFNLQNGLLEPGFTNEGDASSEIEFDLTNVSTLGEVFVTGGSGPDRFTAGDRKIGQQTVLAINLNGNHDGFSPDEDVIVHTALVALGLDGGNGDDFLSSHGTGATGSSPAVAWTTFSDGPGADEVAGGDGNDRFFPQVTADEGDSFSGGDGFDWLILGSRSEQMSLTEDGVRNDGIQCPGLGCEDDFVAADSDRISGGSGPDVIVGGAGHQVLDGGMGNNSISGGPGNDLLTAGTDTDVFHGGAGFDTVSYEHHFSSGVNVFLNGNADDGIPGEHDNVMPDVEGIYGSGKSDLLVGDAARNILDGGPGDDVLNGKSGNDTLVDATSPPVDGGFSIFTGGDLFIGGPGKDTVDERGHNGNLTLTIDGNSNDQVQGDASQGVDNIQTDVENLIADDGDDTLNGGPGTDTCKQGPGTGPKTGCEH